MQMTDDCLFTGFIVAMVVAVAATVTAPWVKAEIEPSTPAPASATLPLDEVLTLFRENEQLKDAQPRPPVTAALQRIDLQARLLDEAVTSTARFEGVVLADGWVRLPLLAVDEHTQLSRMPVLTDSALTVLDGYLSLITNRSGPFQLEVGFLQRAVVDGVSRRARISFADAAVVTGELVFDTGLFSVAGASGAEHKLYPDDGVFQLGWLRTAESRPDVTAKDVVPDIEAVIPTAHASLVSTLEGTHIVRVLYRLRFAGRERIRVQLPAGQRLERAYLNGVAVAVDTDADMLELEAAAANAGEEGGTLELVLHSAGNRYLLSGELHVPLPAASWRVDQLFLTTHLPPVFDYRWTGGSLSPAASVPTASYTYDIPTPGKRADFHQFLVHTATPSLSLGYDVSLEGYYFEAPP